MYTLDFDYFLNQLKAGAYIDDTCFYFTDDPQEEEHYITLDFFKSMKLLTG